MVEKNANNIVRQNNILAYRITPEFNKINTRLPFIYFNFQQIQLNIANFFIMFVNTVSQGQTIF
jgi:hypothetical protein